MIRRPSLTILHSDLLKVVSDLWCNKELDKMTAQQITDEIIFKASDYPLVRSVIVTNKSTSKKIQRASSNYVDHFNRVLNAVRQSLGHKFSKLILNTDREYLILCEVAKDAESYCETFAMPISEGFIEFCEVGLSKIGRNYSLNKFKSYKSKIFQHKSKLDAIINDSDPEVTQQIARAYLIACKIIDEEQASRIFKTHQHDFIYTRELIEINKANYKTWIEAQFSGLKYLDVVPEPYQLHGEESEKRYFSYLKSAKTDWRKEALEKINSRKG